jgi:hypothetical protein
MQRFLALLILSLGPFPVQAIVKPKLESPTPLAQAAELRSLSQRLAKLHLQVRLNTISEVAQQQVVKGIERFDVTLSSLKKAQTNGPAAKTLARVEASWAVQKRATTAATDANIETTRKEFVTSLYELTHAPQTSPVVFESLKLARQQWLFFDATIGPDGNNASSDRNVATTSERIQIA